jgi:hypothetical protein
MALNPRARQPVGRQLPTPPRNLKTPPPAPRPPDRRGEPVADTAGAPDPVIVQAKRDIDAGMVDTDMRATPGLDAALRAQLVPGPGGQPPGAGAKPGL